MKSWLFNREVPPTVIITAHTTVIQLTAACSTGGEQWWFDVLSASGDIQPAKEYVVPIDGQEFYCRDYDLPLAFPTVCRRQRRFERDVYREQILLCVPRPVASQFAKLLKRCPSCEVARPRKRIESHWHDACEALTASLSISKPLPFTHGLY